MRVNETFLRWTGYAREELVGVKRFQDLLTPGGRIYHETHYAPLLRMQGSVREIAVDIVCADGRRLPVLMNSVLLTDADGEPQMVRTTLFDATERKRYERELLAARDRERAAREQVERLQRITAALAAAPDAEAIAEAVTGELMAALRRRSAWRSRASSSREREFDDDAGDGAARARGRAAIARDGLLRAGPRSTPRPFAPDERAFLVAVARQTALALERARLYEETRDVAHTLQRSLLAGAPPGDPRFEIATLYQPAVEHLEVGGDWHDAFALPGGKVGIVVGDVVGRGLRAASAMGQLRSAVRALAGAGLGPEAVIAPPRHVRRAGRGRPVRDARLRRGRSRHRRGRARRRRPPPADPARRRAARSTSAAARRRWASIDADAAAHPGHASRSPRATGFVLYTDGLVERRSESLDVGIERLVQAIRDRPDARPQYLVDALHRTRRRRRRRLRPRLPPNLKPKGQAPLEGV